jgi:hypothetical protein
MPNRKKKRKKSVPKARARRVISRTVGPSVAFKGVAVPEPVTDVLTERAYITTEPEVEIRKPATLAQALTEPAVAVVKPKTKVKRVKIKTRRAA